MEKKSGIDIAAPMDARSIPMGRVSAPKVMMMLYPIMEAVRSGGDLENIGGCGKYCKNIVCPDGCVLFRLTARELGNENFFKGKFCNSF